MKRLNPNKPGSTTRVLAVVLPDSRALRRHATWCAACCAALAMTLLLPPSASAGWPLEAAAPSTLGFGATYSAADGTSATHRGLDLASAAGSSVRAPLAGRVSFAGRVPGSGGGTVLAVTLATASASITLMPLSSAAVKVGAELAEGEAVGQLAGTGDASSSEPHLHVGARKGDLYVDPMSLIGPPAVQPDAAQQPAEPAPGTSSLKAKVGAEAPPLSSAQVAVLTAAAPGASALQPSGGTAVSVEAVGMGAPAGALTPGASVAPGVSVAGAMDVAATPSSPVQGLSHALAAAVGGRGTSRSGEVVPEGAIVEWILGLASRGLQAGARLLVGVLLALGALWPIWRSERRKGAGQLSVRPIRDDVAAVTGR